MLVHLVDLSAFEGSAAADLETVERELGAFDPELLARDRIVVGSKLDAARPERRAELRSAAESRGLAYLEISAATGEGVDRAGRRARRAAWSARREARPLRRQLRPDPRRSPRRSRARRATGWRSSGWSTCPPRSRRTSPGGAWRRRCARYAMVELALLDEPRLVVSDFELTLDRPAYTVDTLRLRRRARRRAAPRPRLGLVRRARRLAASGRRSSSSPPLVVVVRPGSERERVLAALPAPLAARIERARLVWVETPPHPASASEIRRRLAAGEPLPEGWLDPRVLTFAAKYRLYR